MSPDLSNSISYFLPECALVLTILLAALNSVLKSKSFISVKLLSLLGIVLAMVFSVLRVYYDPALIFSSMATADHASSFSSIAILLSGFVIVFFSGKNCKTNLDAEQYIFILTALLGSLFIASSVNFVMLFSASVLIDSSLILTAYSGISKTGDKSSVIKFGIYSAVSACMLTLGAALIYGIAGSLNYYTINSFLSINPYNTTTLLLAVLLIAFGLGSKCFIFPFAFSTSKTSEKTDTAFFGLISGPVLISGLIALSRFLLTAFHNSNTEVTDKLIFTTLPGFYWNGIVIIFAIISIATSSVLLFGQTKLRKSFSYLIAIQSALFLFGLSSMSRVGFSISFGFLIIIALCSSIFLIISNAFDDNEKEIEIVDILLNPGNKKLLISAFLVMLFTFSGLPITLGFSSRLALFNVLNETSFKWILVLTIVSSLLILLFFMKIFIRKISSGSDISENSADFSITERIFISAISILLILTGMFFQQLAVSLRFYANFF